MPSDTEARAKSGFEFGQAAEHRFGAVAKPWDESRAGLFGEAHRHFVFEHVPGGRRIVTDEARRGLRREPFTHVPLGEARAFGDLPGRHPALFGHRLVQAEPVAQCDERRGRDCAELIDHARHEVFDFLLIVLHVPPP